MAKGDRERAAKQSRGSPQVKVFLVVMRVPSDPHSSLEIQRFGLTEGILLRNQ